MTVDDIRNAFAAYKHPYWQVVGTQPANGEGQDIYTCDNYHMMNTLYWLILKSNGFSQTSKEISQTVTFQLACEKQMGLYARFPSRMNDDISQDEIYGICLASPAGALDIEEYGAKLSQWWCYWLANPNHWHWDYFFGRYPTFIPFVKAQASKSVWLWQFVWCIGFLLSACTSHTETSGKLLAYIQMNGKMNDKFFPKLAIKLWKHIMMNRYPNGMKDIYSIYFADQPNHPFIQYARSDFE